MACCRRCELFPLQGILVGFTASMVDSACTPALHINNHQGPVSRKDYLESIQTLLFILLTPGCRVFTFLSATEALAGRCVEFSSLVSPSARAANLAAFRSGAAQVQCHLFQLLATACKLAAGCTLTNIAQVEDVRHRLSVVCE